jgi:hypothetical protein
VAALVEVRLTAVRDQAEPARRKVNNDGEELNRVNGFRTSSGVQKGEKHLATASVGGVRAWLQLGK